MPNRKVLYYIFLIGLMLAVINSIMTIYLEGGEGGKTTTYFYLIIFSIYYLINIIPYIIYSIVLGSYQPSVYISVLLNFMTFFIPFCSPYIILQAIRKRREYRKSI